MVDSAIVKITAVECWNANSLQDGSPYEFSLGSYKYTRPTYEVHFLCITN